MGLTQEIKTAWGVVYFAGLSLVGTGVDAGSVVQFETEPGSFDIEFFDDDVVSGDHNDRRVRHRGNDLLIQDRSGTLAGAERVEADGLPPIATRSAGQRELKLSASQRSIAPAQSGIDVVSDLNRGPREWLVNVGEIPSLDTPENGPLAVFGQVLGGGVEVIDAINDLTAFSSFGGGRTVPVRNDAEERLNPLVPAGEDEAVVISSITFLADPTEIESQE